MLCDRFTQGAREAGHDVEKVSLADLKIGYCRGCGVCYDLHKPCPQSDDAAAVVEKMIAAEIIVMATPVYFYTMSAQLKTLIDRCCARYTEISGKEFVFIVTAADRDRKALERTVDGLRGFTDCLDDPVERDIIYGAGAWHTGQIAATPAYDQAYRAGLNI